MPPAVINSTGSVFIQDLEVENMTRELTMLQASLDEVIKYPVLPSILGQALSTIEHLSSNILRHPYDVNSALMISQLWPPLAQIEAHHGTTTLALRIERYRIMETNALPWFWLDKALQCCRSFLAGTPTTEMQGWLIDLVTDVYHYVLNSIRTWHLEPSDYFGSQVNVAPFHYNRLKQRYYDEKDKHDCAAMHEDIIALVKDILVQWLSFPKEFPSRYQATFFMTLETSNLSPLLYLSTTWRAYQSLRSYVFPNTSRGWSLTWFHSLSAVLESHAITSFGSPENNILIDVEACFQKFNDLIKRPRQFLDNTSVMVAPTQPPTNPLTFTSSEAGLLEISNFIKQLLPLLRGQSSSSMSPQQTLVIQNSDFYSPFRELGACRLNITAPGGPFDNSQRSDATASHLCAIEGFAGALIGRGITFATPAGREAKTYFSSLQEWKKLCQSHDDDWIFNLRAYGYPAKHRGIKNASQYFETARKKWPARIRLFKTTGEKISFQAFFKWLKQLGNLLPGMGDLCNYLLTADYVYAGLVTAPTSQEMAESLRRVDAGSLKTLVHLGLVPPRKQDNGQLIPFNQYDQYIVNTLDSLIKHMEEVFSSEERSLMGFDLIMLEHTLCKYLRLQRKGS
ncbi:MAG TPA: hypothetical protein VGO47_14495 [Chlamydiales bacterium]|jgi:hypothetical protein|nr:hypothetical protein [Chlamydiales bacterium]